MNQVDVDIRKLRNRRVRRLVFLGLLLFLVALARFTVCRSPFTGKKFNKIEWSSVELGPRDYTRCQMISDLFGSHLERGMSKSEVESLLGLPDEVISSSGRYKYFLGYCSGFGIDVDILEISFDIDGKVNSFHHYQS